MLDSFSGLLGAIAIVALVVVAMRQQRRVAALEREITALRSLIMPGEGRAATKPAAAASARVSSPASLSPSTAETASAATAGSAAMPDQADTGASDEPGLAALRPKSVETAAATESDAKASAEADEAGASESEKALAEVPAAPAAGSVAKPGIAAKAPPKTQDLETALGTRWAVWVGGVALALGGIFLVRYSIEAGWFGPGTRLILAGLFGLLLVAGGELIRRTGFAVPVPGIAGAYIPAILTAAGAFTLFGTVYAAHGIYGFIGPAAAFTLLGAIGIATIALALVHGQALAGVGLLGSFVTPVLVSSQAPNAWALFGYLAIVLVSAVAIARIRLWRLLASAAFAGTGLWCLLYMADVRPPDLAVVGFINAVTLASLAVIWCRGEQGTGPGYHSFPASVPAFFVAVAAMGLMIDPEFQALGGIFYGTALFIAMLALAAWRAGALPLLYGAGIAIVLVYLRLGLAGLFEFEVMGEPVSVEGFSVAPSAGALFYPGLILSAVFIAAGVLMARILAASRAGGASWAASAAIVPIVVLCALWNAFGNPDVDYPYAVGALVLAFALVAGAEFVSRAEPPPLAGGTAISFLLAGAGAALVGAIHMGFGPALTTILVGAAAVLPALATRWRSWPALGWLSVGAVVVVLARAAIDPTIVGAAALGTTPIFNALLPGYGIPALAFGFAAWQLGRTTAGRPRLAMQGAAIFFALLALAMLTRHAMHGGILDTGEVTLAEQAIYSLIALAAGGILISLDLRAPSSVLRYGSLAIGVLSVAMIAMQHFLLLDPLFTDESTGKIPVFNLLFLAYLLPAIAAALLAWYAREKRPQWYGMMLGVTAAALAFMYATLSVRRVFKGEFIGLWKGLEPLETYTYSALWLVMGVALLVAGVRTGSFVMRVASGALIAIAVAKVFLFDMSELEGVLRALSFIGLGAVLIGIGLFYQRLLTRAAAR
ncbi:DUF2339 domain-containing protein [Mesorhizobium sp. LHD-90]|uniref:DUF2339 domain-containing protein n=1 Tax=Mesorhizobium sp. LHD-90 TaxID=3071414 RepID=UPI0027E151EA|nr:DUF2339 domain-containing protein [Mesorhizobium sp. LHD-90]MDQ6438002.1 DUF2339 domain-containing protein [Mesorhizobium sp. LHD-90]